MSKTVSGLVSYAKAQVGRPYWYGARGQIATESLYKSLKKSYSSYYTASDFASQYGKKVHDCSGLIVGYMCCSGNNTDMDEYNSKYDTNSSGMYSQASVKGTMSSFPKTNGVLVFKTNNGSPSGIHHVGVYCTDGYVYEAKGHSYGVLKTAFKSSDWNYWAQFKWLDYGSSSSSSSSSSSGSSTKSSGTSSSGSSSSSSNKYTATLSVDGQIGPNTVKRAQTVYGCSDIDGYIDGQQSASKKYWTAVTSKACGWTGGASPFVKKLQTALKNAGYSPGTVDGKLGKNTATALQKFLIAKGYSCGKDGADGKIGSNSAKAFQNYLNAQK